MTNQTDFRLEALARVRDAERRQQQALLAEVVIALSRIDRKIDELAQQLTKIRRHSLLADSTGPVSADRLRAHHQFVGHLEAEHKQLQLEKQELELQLESQRGNLIQSDRDSKVLEKLRNRKLLGDRQRQLQAESRSTDALSQRAHLERRKSAGWP